MTRKREEEVAKERKRQKRKGNVAEEQMRHMTENQMKKGSKEKESEGPQLLSMFSES